MKKLIFLLLLTGLCRSPWAAGAATGKCTVAEIDRNRMVLKCEQLRSEIRQGDEIKFKTVKQKPQKEGS